MVPGGSRSFRRFGTTFGADDLDEFEDALTVAFDLLIGLVRRGGRVLIEVLKNLLLQIEERELEEGSLN